MKVKDIAWKLDSPKSPKRKKGKKRSSVVKKIIIGFIFLLAVGGGYAGWKGLNSSNESTSYGINKDKDYQKLVDKTSQALKKAKKTRNSKDIERVQKDILKLKKNDRESYQKKLDQLKSAISQLNITTTAVKKAESTKNEKDISTAQKLVDKLTSSYLTNDKKALQARLNKLHTANKGNSGDNVNSTQPSSNSGDTSNTDSGAGNGDNSIADNGSSTAGNTQAPSQQAPEQQTPPSQPASQPSSSQGTPSTGSSGLKPIPIPPPPLSSVSADESGN